MLSDNYKQFISQSVRPVIIGQEHCSLTRTLTLPFVSEHFPT